MKERVWLTVDGALMQVGLGDVPAALEQELALPIPLLPESPRNADQFCTFDVVEHDDVRARVDRFVRCSRLTLMAGRSAPPARRIAGSSPTTRPRVGERAVLDVHDDDEDPLHDPMTA